MIKAIICFCIITFGLSTSYSQDTITQISHLVAQLKQGGYVIVMRHGATHKDQADTDPLRFDDISKQRLLNESGKEMAKQLGDHFRKRGIKFGKVYSSKFNRAFETARLVGDSSVITTLDITEGGLVVSPIENERRAEALRTMVGIKPENAKNTLIVTHKPNIMDAFGKDWFSVKEGEMTIFKPEESGKARMIGRVQALDWIKITRQKL